MSGYPMDAMVLKMQRDSLRDALRKVLDTHDRCAKAAMGHHGCRESFNAHKLAVLAASDAEREARVLLLTLRDGA